MKQTMKWHALLGIIISVIFGLLMLSQIDLDRLGMALHSARYRFLVLAALIQMSTHLVRAWRWRYLIEPVKPVSLFSLLSATSIGFMVNMVLPAHAGEVVRAYVIGQREQVSTMAALATIVMERTADLVSMVLILILVVTAPGLPVTEGPLAEGLKIGGYFAASLGVVLIGILWGLQAKTAPILRFLEPCMGVFPVSWRGRLLAALASFALGLRALRNGRHLVAVLMLSLLLWSLIAVCNLLVFWAFDIELPVVAAFFILVVQILSAAVPSAPGYVGTFHVAVVASLAVFQITPELALSMAIMMHAVFFFPFIVIGLPFLWSESLSLRDLSAMKNLGISNAILP